MKAKTYSTPSAQIVLLATEDIMELSVNQTNQNVTEDRVNINDLF